MKKTLQNIVLAGSLALGIASDGCYNTDGYKSVPQPTVSREVTEKEDYTPTLEDFKRVLGDRYIPKREEELRRFCIKWPKEDRKMIFQIYSDIDNFKKTLSEKTLQKYERFDVDSLPLSEIREYQDTAPWKLVSNGLESEEDKMIIFLLHDFYKEPWDGKVNLFP